MTKRKAALKVGDEVAVTWWDIYSQGRVIGGDDSAAVLPEFISYGRVSHVGSDKIVILHEEEIVEPGQPPHREPTVFPIGCIKSVRKATRFEEVTFKKRAVDR